MDQKLKDYWNNNKIMFFLVIIPAILIFVLRDVIFSALVGSARKVSEDAKKQDAVLQSQADALKVEAAKTQQEAKDLDKKIEDRKSDDVSEDWNKN